MVGHAIDMNIIYVDDTNGSKLVCDSFCMKSDRIPTAAIKFLQLIINDTELTWGGNFTLVDVVHIDDQYYERDQNRLYCEYHWAHRDCFNETISDGFDFGTCDKYTTTTTTTESATKGGSTIASIAYIPILCLIVSILCYH